MFYPWCFFYLFHHEISKLPQPIAVKLCHMIAIWVRFIMQVQKFGDPPPKKLGAKYMQNLARFQTTSNFDREYLRNGSRYPKSENILIESDSSRVPRKTSGELLSTNYRELDVSLDPLKLHFSGDYFSALRGCWPLKFLHALQIDQGLLAHTPNGDGSSRQKFKGEHVKLGLKFRVWASITLRLVGVTSRNFSTRRAVRHGCSIAHYFWERPVP